MVHRVFSYGTLRQPEVQVALFGRAVPTVADALPGYRVDWLTITDPAVIATSGSDRHPILRPGRAEDAVDGAYLELSDAELAWADAYEVDDYARTAVTLASGAEAWVYLAADIAP
ncbi:gamma-glutamylcyclotransferase family protein [Nocardioides humi]|uniref:Gamma-glutamylcyclotransferase n=1 Tax=Nocardioides humi TaxID=449461 RepID=A0ABN2ATU5_9ACTN|nr:gamma-glutamylcyclotransferase family protein [Nocardioides humi]